ncbi:MAG: hypothetical protein JXR69_06180 [Candidatus Delongbacteria bacterium]|nr:hypothetical protein [Candidatus Delongbacteria bacterium]
MEKSLFAAILLGVLSIFAESTNNLFVANIDSTLYIATKYNGNYDLITTWDNCMANDLYTFRTVALYTNSEDHVSEDVTRTYYEPILRAITTDNIGPIAFNGDFAGGNHTYTDSLSNTYKTAKTTKIEIYINDEIITGNFSTYTDEVIIKVSNDIYNPIELPVENVYINENIEYRVFDKSIEVKVEHVIKHDLYVNSYYGMQAANNADMQKYISMINSQYTSQQIMSSGLTAGIISDYPNCYKAIHFNNDSTVCQELFMYPDEGLFSNKESYISPTTYYSSIFVGGGTVPLLKTYFNQIRNKNMTAGDSYYWKGVYSWFDNNELNTYYVKTDGKDEDTGRSWASAFASYQKAYDSARSGEQVWIAEGTYKPTFDFELDLGEKGKHFKLKNGVKFYGGFSGTETSILERNYNIYKTILSGDIGIANDSTDNVYHVFYHPAGTDLDSTAVIDGFVITKGAASAPEGDYRFGAGIFNWTSSPTIINCDFIENYSNGYLGGGGAMYNNVQSNPKITNCYFFRNFAAHDGAGIFNIGSSPILTNCTFAENYCEFGTVFNNNNSNGTYTNCLWENNTVTAGGGGVMNWNSSATIDRCKIINNQALGSCGGGIWNQGASSSPVITNTLVADNYLTSELYGWGGGIYNYDQCSPTITNCTIVNNYSNNLGGGLFIRTSDVAVENCIIYNNDAGNTGDDIYVYSGTSSNIYNSCYSNLTNDVYGDLTPINCITSDPIFKNIGDDPYSIASDSPCIDTGDNSFVNTNLDVIGNIRIIDGDLNTIEIIDMGAYEANTFSSPENITINYSGSYITISWDEVASANSYDIYSSDNPYDSFSRVAIITTNSYVTNISSSKQFYYIIANTNEIKSIKQSSLK